MTAVLVAMSAGLLVALLVAGAVLVYVGFPHYGRDSRLVAWLAGPLSRVADRVRPRGSVPTRGLLSSPDRDEQMSRRFERAEHRIMHPFERHRHPRRQRSTG